MDLYPFLYFSQILVLRMCVSGVPNLRRAEVRAACEDFSNIIGSIQDGIVYKGTLSSGVEIAVVSTAVTSSKYWNKSMEAQFRRKVLVPWME